jgi:hypothetical protein
LRPDKAIRIKSMGSLVRSDCTQRLGPENAINSKRGKRESRIHESLLNLGDRTLLVPESEQALVIEASLQHRVTGETRRLKVVTVTNCALEHSWAARFPTISL